MKRYRFLFGASLIWVALGGPFSSVGVKADQSDDLLRSISAANQKLIGLPSDIAGSIEENAQINSGLNEQVEAFDAQLATIRDEIKDKREKKVDVREIMNAIKNQTYKLKEQTQKLETIQNKIAAMLPKLQDAVEQNESVQESRRILAAVYQDRVKATKLIQAIEENKSAEVRNLLGQGARGTKVEVQEIKNADGEMVTFRVGNLIHCLSTKLQCGGESSSLTKAAGGSVPKAVEAIKPLKSSLVAAGKQATSLDKAFERFRAAVESMYDDANLSESKAMELQNVMTQVAEAAAAYSQASQKVDSMHRVVIGNLSP